MRPVKLATLPNVELCRLGQWQSGGGIVDVTSERLDSIVAASQDPMIDLPALKLGHNSPLNDGQPAYGWVRNLRRVGDSLVGDITEVPEKLAAIAKHAYKRRSAEIRFNQRGTGGKSWPATLSAVSLLGVTPPAVKGMPDLDGVYFAEDTGDATTLFIFDETATLSEEPIIHDGANATDQGATAMDIKDLLAALSLPETATAEEATAAITTLVEKAKAPALLSDPDTIVISKAVWEETQRRAAQASDLEGQLSEKAVRDAVDAALSEGKIAPVEEDAWIAKLSGPDKAYHAELLARFPTNKAMTVAPRTTPGQPASASDGMPSDAQLAEFISGYNPNIVTS